MTKHKHPDWTEWGKRRAMSHELSRVMNEAVKHVMTTPIEPGGGWFAQRYLGEFHGGSELREPFHFKVTAKDPAKLELAATLEKAVNADEFIAMRMTAANNAIHDLLGLPRKGREPDYIHGRWCIHCHNSLPEDWGIKLCDVCGGATGFDGNLEGLMREVEE